MSSGLPSPHFQHPGSPPLRPEVPEGVIPAPLPEPPPPARQSDAPFAVWAPFAAMLIAVVVALVGVGIITIFVEATGTDVDAKDLPTGITVAGTLVQDAALIGAALLCAAAGGTRPTAWAFGFRPARLWRSVGLAAALMVTFYLFSFVWALALGIKENDDLAEDLGAKDSTLNLIVVAILVTIVAPLTEEFFFRGFTFPALAGRIGMIPGALLTGIIFGAIHAGGTKAEFLVPLAVFGFLLCLLYHFTGSLLPCICLHAVNNAVALGVTLEWKFWQVILAVIVAPSIVMAISLWLTRRPHLPPAGPVPSA